MLPSFRVTSQLFWRLSEENIKSWLRSDLDSAYIDGLFCVSLASWFEVE
jgi:hypothetical protein